MIEHDPNHPYLRRRTEYWLQSDAQRRSWGPFADEDAAWRYLFGRESSDEDRQQHKDAGWHVGPINKWPSAEWRDTEGDAVDVTHWAPMNTHDFISLLGAYRAQMETLTNSARLRRRRAAYRGAVRAARVLGAIDADEAAVLYEAGEVVFRARWEEIAPPPRQPA